MGSVNLIREKEFKICSYSAGITFQNNLTSYFFQFAIQGSNFTSDGFHQVAGTSLATDQDIFPIFLIDPDQELACLLEVWD
jgi:hypothetical protein